MLIGALLRFVIHKTIAYIYLDLVLAILLQCIYVRSRLFQSGCFSEVVQYLANKGFVKLPSRTNTVKDRWVPLIKPPCWPSIELPLRNNQTEKALILHIYIEAK